MKPHNYFFYVLILGLLVASLRLAGTGVYSLLKTNSFAKVKACDEEPYTEAIVLWNETFGDIWILKVYINEIIPTGTPTNTSPYVGFIISFEILFIVTIAYTVRIKKRKVKK